MAKPKGGATGVPDGVPLGLDSFPATIMAMDFPWEPGSERGKREFLSAFFTTGTLARAAKLSKVTQTQHYRWLKSDPQYATAFEMVKQQAKAPRGLKSVILQGDGGLPKEELAKLLREMVSSDQAIGYLSECLAGAHGPVAFAKAWDLAMAHAHGAPAQEVVWKGVLAKIDFEKLPSAVISRILDHGEDPVLVISSYIEAMGRDMPPELLRAGGEVGSGRVLPSVPPAADSLGVLVPPPPPRATPRHEAQDAHRTATDL